MPSVDQVLSLVRPDILALTAYSSARKESKGGRVWLDANENPQTPSAAKPLLNRYPEPQPADLVAQLAALYRVAAAQVLVTRGSDEGIDLLLRTFCRAGQDAILITPPTYGMYVVAAGIQGARTVTVPLIREKNFALDAAAVLKAVLAASKPSGEGGTPEVKLVFLCSPNNPTGGLLERAAVLSLVKSLAGRAVVVVDEAYVDFSGQPSLAAEIPVNPNLVVLRTLSKAYGLAGARVGTTIADPAVIAVLQKVIAPYPVPAPVLIAALAALTPAGLVAARNSVAAIVAERSRLAVALPKLPAVKHVWPSDANYLLVEVADATRAMMAGRAAGVIWRDRSKDVSNCIRITVGTAEENNATLEVLSRV
ncbi:histidinol-phosphate transaminase [Opitutus sp. GAS368]|jgi:histidinol-phosphate aminotransferase|uniref:histidinol-phosphate transaminase n=1 Tax=Opitutus sp. GAS368 TaxID=1882749 RepID=UPI00087C7566|nr:histidinol-phosphate transaminase [Opitutus sp. GAS368]SDR98157.1 histidinol-phosphate aminotransferase [Opitutus sp. GAS368]